MEIVKTKDGKQFLNSEARLVGSAKKVRDRDITKPAVVGEFPVFVERGGSYRMFTYSSKIIAIEEGEPPSAPAAAPA